MRYAGRQQHAAAGRARRPHSIDDDPNILELFPRYSEGIGEGGENGNGGSMLIVMHNRDIEHFSEPPLNLKAAGSTNIFEIDRPEPRSDSLYNPYDLIRVLCIQAQWPGINPCQFLEQHDLAFHNRQGRFRT